MLHLNAHSGSVHFLPNQQWYGRHATPDDSRGRINLNAVERGQLNVALPNRVRQSAAVAAETVDDSVHFAAVFVAHKPARHGYERWLSFLPERLIVTPD